MRHENEEISKKVDFIKTQADELANNETADKGAAEMEIGIAVEEIEAIARDLANAYDDEIEAHQTTQAELEECQGYADEQEEEKETVLESLGAIPGLDLTDDRHKDAWAAILPMMNKHDFYERLEQIKQIAEA